MWSNGYSLREVNNRVAVVLACCWPRRFLPVFSRCDIKYRSALIAGCLSTITSKFCLFHYAPLSTQWGRQRAPFCFDVMKQGMLLITFEFIIPAAVYHFQSVIWKLDC